MGSQRSNFPALNIKLSDGMSSDTTKLSKRAIGALATKLQKESGNFEGTARVTYSRNTYNEFGFKDKADFMNKVEPCIEKELLDELSN